MQAGPIHTFSGGLGGSPVSAELNTHSPSLIRAKASTATVS